MARPPHLAATRSLSERQRGRVTAVVLWALLGVALVVVVVGYRALSRPDLSAWRERFELEPGRCDRGEAAPPCVEAAWLGVATLLFDDGETRLLVDGFFSRPGLLDVLLDRAVSPDTAAIEAGLSRAGLSRADAVMTVHSHYDHAMDAAEVAKRLDAMLLGSRSTAFVGRGGGVPEDRIAVVEEGRSTVFGDFEVTFHPGRHVPLPAGQGAIGEELDAPLSPPAAVSDYVEGGSFTIEIAHPAGVALVQGSAGFVEGALEGVDADVVLLGIGNLARQSQAYRDAYYRELLDRVGARRVVPIHWDDFTLPPGTLEPFPVLFGDVSETFAEIEARARAGGALELALMPPWQRVVLLRGVEGG